MSATTSDEPRLLREMRGLARQRPRSGADRIHHVWSYDFVANRTEDGRQVKLLAVIDEYTRECLPIEVGRSFTSREVIGRMTVSVRRWQHGRITFVAITARSSWLVRSVAGSTRRVSGPYSSPKAAHGRTATLNHSTESFGTSCSWVSCS